LKAFFLAGAVVLDLLRVGAQHLIHPLLRSRPRR
jgi:hypothetical protein